MPRPNDVHNNRTLETISVAYLQDLDQFVAPKVFGIVPVTKQSDIFFKFDKGDFNRDNMQVRPPSTESAGMDYDLTTDTYKTTRYALHHDVDDETRDNADGDLVDDTTIMEILTLNSFIKFERLFMAEYFTTGVWTGSSTGTDIVASVKWDTAGSTPVNDVEVQREALRKNTAKRPNFMVVVPAVHRALKNNADILSRLGGNDMGIVSNAAMAAIFEVDEYIIADSVYNTAEKGATTAMSFIAGTDGVLLGYKEPRPRKKALSAGYIFAHTKGGSNSWGLAARKFRMEELTSDRLELEFQLDPKLVCADCCAFMSDVLS